MAVINGTSGNDTLNGTNGNDSLEGNAGSDILYGYKGNDLLEGEASNDLLVGGFGNDTLIGGSGTNTYYGGPGNDTFVDEDPLSEILDTDTFIINSPNEGLDTITNFGISDNIQISAEGFGIPVDAFDAFSYNYSTNLLYFEETPIARVDSGVLPEYNIIIIP